MVRLVDQISKPSLFRRSLWLVDTTEVWVVAGLTVASILISVILPITLLFAGSYWVLRWIIGGRPSVRTPSDLPVVLLVTTLPITLLITPERDITLEQVLRLLTGVSIYYAIANWTNSRRRLCLLINGLHIAGIALASSAIVTIQWSAWNKLPFIPPSLYKRLPLLVSDVVNPNVMAGALVILLPLVVALPLFAARSIRRFEWPLIVLSLLTMSWILVLTQSRGGLLAFGVALVLLVVLRWRYGFILAIGMLVIALASLSTEWGLAQLRALSSDPTLGGFDNRLEIWSRAIYMIQDHPLTGIGMGTFRQVMDISYPLFQTTAGIPHAHNLFLQIAVDIGVPGLIAWIVILIVITRGSWQIYRVGAATNDTWATAVGAGLMGCQVALVTHGIMDAVTWGMVRTAALIWALWGLAAASQRVLVVIRPPLLSQDGEIKGSTAVFVESDRRKQAPPTHTGIRDHTSGY